MQNVASNSTVGINMQAPQPANINQGATDITSLDQKYYAISRQIAKDVGIDPNKIPQVPVETLATTVGDFFDQKRALEEGEKEFEKIQQSWYRYVVEPTDPNPLQLAMGGQLFAASIDDEIKIDIKEVNNGVVRDFLNCAKHLGAKAEIDEKGRIKMRREDVVQAAVVYRLTHPSSRSDDIVLYKQLGDGLSKVDQSIDKKNSTFSSVTSVLSIASMALTGIAAFSPALGASTPFLIGLLAIQAISLIPRVISLCRSLVKMGYNKEANKINEGLTNIRRATNLVMKDTENKAQKGYEYGIKYLQEKGMPKGVSEKQIGMVTPASLNNQQQRAMNNAYNNNYPPRQIKQDTPGYSLETNNRAKCNCTGRS